VATSASSKRAESAATTPLDDLEVSIFLFYHVSGVDKQVAEETYLRHVGYMRGVKHVFRGGEKKS
jgi:hypothetical protein